MLAAVSNSGAAKLERKNTVCKLSEILAVLLLKVGVIRTCTEKLGLKRPNFRK